jgi:hypothetical protein
MEDPRGHRLRRLRQVVDEPLTATLERPEYEIL